MLITSKSINCRGIRSENFNDPGDEQKRAQRGRAYFDTLWGSPSAGQAQRDRANKYYPDLCTWDHKSDKSLVATETYHELADLLNIKTNYELWMSEDAILSNKETQMCNLALLTCNNTPTQASWHLHGLLRHGATKQEAQFAQDLALEVAHQFGAKTGNIELVQNLGTTG